MWSRRQRDIYVPESLTIVGNGFLGNRRSLASTECTFISVWVMGIVYKQWDRGCSFRQLQRRDRVHDIHIYIFTSRLPSHSNREGCRLRSLVLSVFLWCSVRMCSVCLGRCAQSEVWSCTVSAVSWTLGPSMVYFSKRKTSFKKEICTYFPQSPLHYT